METQYRAGATGDKEMTVAVLEFLQGDPARIALFEETERAILSLGNSNMEVKKTQISWGNPCKFAFLSLPRKAAHKHGLILTFGLSCCIEHPRIHQAVQPYPNRWTHHVLLLSPEDVDDTIREWLAQSYLFSSLKR